MTSRNIDLLVYPFSLRKTDESPDCVPINNPIVSNKKIWFQEDNVGFLRNINYCICFIYSFNRFLFSFTNRAGVDKKVTSLHKPNNLLSQLFFVIDRKAAAAFSHSMVGCTNCIRKEGRHQTSLMARERFFNRTFVRYHNVLLAKKREPVVIQIICSMKSQCTPYFCWWEIPSVKGQPPIIFWCPYCQYIIPFQKADIFRCCCMPILRNFVRWWAGNGTQKCLLSSALKWSFRFCTSPALFTKRSSLSSMDLNLSTKSRTDCNELRSTWSSRTSPPFEDSRIFRTAASPLWAFLQAR